MLCGFLLSSSSEKWYNRVMKGNTDLKPSKRTKSLDIRVTANQWQANPRQQKFLELYFDPMSKTYANIYRSAREAGYSESHSRTLTRSKNKNMWLKEYQSKTELTPEHILQGVQNIATQGNAKNSDRLRAYELLARLHGMLVDKSITATVNIQDIIKDLK